MSDEGSESFAIRCVIIIDCPRPSAFTFLPVSVSLLSVFVFFCVFILMAFSVYLYLFFSVLFFFRYTPT